MLTIVIPTLNEAGHIGRILRALAPQLGEGDRLLVVDSASRDATPAIAAEFAEVLSTPKEGIGLARTRGARHAATPWVGFLDADSVPCADWVARAKGHLARGASGVSGLGLYDARGPRRWLYDGFSRCVFGGARLSYAFTRTPYLIGNDMAIQRALFLEVGGFRSVVCEDYDFGRRLRGHGGRFAFDPKLTVRYSTRKFDEHGFLPTLLEWRRGMKAIRAGEGQASQDYSAWRGGG